jgi:hypothetical protein
VAKPEPAFDDLPFSTFEAGNNGCAAGANDSLTADDAFAVADGISVGIFFLDML